MDETIAQNQTVNQKNPLLAAIASFFVPGLGQVYNGEGFLKGFLYMIGVFIGAILFFIPGLLIALYGIYNAYTVAQKINAGTLPYKETPPMNLIIYIVLYVVLLVVYVFIVTVILAAIIAAFVFSSTTGY